jgi:hypothetical protein
MAKTNGKAEPKYLNGIRHPKKRAFLRAYADTFNVTFSAELAKIERHTHYAWLQNDEHFVEAFELAKEVGSKSLEAEVVRRAKDGVRRVKFYRGQPILIPCKPDDPEAVEVDGKYVKPYSEREFSDVLAIFILKGEMPEKYRERYEYHDGDSEIQETIEQELALLANREAAISSAVSQGPPSGNGDAGGNGSPPTSG